MNNNTSLESITDVAREIVSREYYTEDHIKTLEALGYKLLTEEGTDRIVFANESTVIKIVQYATDTNLNYDETVVWNEVQHTEDEHLFCPVLDAGPHYRWIKMSRCEKKPEKIDEYESKIANTQWKINDLHANNIGTYQHKESGEMRLVCFDYPNATQADSLPPK